MSDPETPAAPEIPATSSTPVDSAALRDRFDAVAARAGLDEDFADEVNDKAVRWLADQKLEPTRENLGRFLDDLKAKKPKLFAAPVATAAPTTSTAPVYPNAAPATPAPATVETPYTRWRALRETGRQAEAEAYFRLNASAIRRHA